MDLECHHCGSKNFKTFHSLKQHLEKEFLELKKASDPQLSEADGKVSDKTSISKRKSKDEDISEERDNKKVKISEES
jgi:hypothetical protein